MKRVLTLVATVGAMVASGLAFSYDGQTCKEAGNCWEAKPGYPEKIAGSKYDPKHEAAELSKQEAAIKAIDERNAKRIANAKATGSFKFDVK
ncbi:methanol dehydrogenase [Methylobacillus glycogenes]|uniref:methanol dehydrogenase n=1 Tax=Methylobacillus glycogenes TaxID=406 RepID=UPI00046EF8B1|nr:methanol dehydrogenase [Methylobacillus glycogenes]